MKLTNKQTKLNNNKYRFQRELIYVIQYSMSNPVKSLMANAYYNQGSTNK